MKNKVKRKSSKERNTVEDKNEIIENHEVSSSRHRKILQHYDDDWHNIKHTIRNMRQNITDIKRSCKRI